jgi:hypothetical protein
MSAASAMAYKLRCRAAGLCDHCGKPCAPFWACEARRRYRARRYRLSRPATKRGRELRAKFADSFGPTVLMDVRRNYRGLDGDAALFIENHPEIFHDKQDRALKYAVSIQEVRSI